MFLSLERFRIARADSGPMPQYTFRWGQQSHPQIFHLRHVRQFFLFSDDILALSNQELGLPLHHPAIQGRLHTFVA
jgi:hypothetical protein